MKKVTEFIAFIEGILPHEMNDALHKEKLELKQALQEHGPHCSLHNHEQYEQKLQIMLAKSKAQNLIAAETK